MFNQLEVSDLTANTVGRTVFSNPCRQKIVNHLVQYIFYCLVTKHVALIWLRAKNTQRYANTPSKDLEIKLSWPTGQKPSGGAQLRVLASG